AAVLASGLRGRPARTRFVCGLAAGVGLYGPGLFWMTNFSAPGYPIAVLIEASFLAAAALLVVPGPGRLLALPAALVLFEAARGSWPFGGMPLAHLALGQVGGPLRSEEHTSELQSRVDLVCRLLPGDETISS